MQIPTPHTNERPSVYADRLGQWYGCITPAKERKAAGQYFTPVPVADFMASLCTVQKDVLRVLDPGAGTGTLACAVCEHVISRSSKPSVITVCATENDIALLPLLSVTLEYLRSWLQKRQVKLDFVIQSDDFVLKYAPMLMPSLTTEGRAAFDLVISNPPYFKLPKSDLRAQVAASVVHGQPNIYALFMAIAASMLSLEGELIFLIPRSFTSGLYFKRFREYLFSRVTPTAIHIFDSRRNTFERDEVLQENMVLRAHRVTSSHNSTSVKISSSQGFHDLAQSTARIVPLQTVLSGINRTLFIPTSASDDEAIRVVKSWTGSLQAYGLEISTGPVVPFRAVSLLSDIGMLQTHAPLIWMQSVQPMSVQWPARLRRKPQYIELSKQAMRILLPNKNYVLLRRVSAKEDKRRLTAAPLGQKYFDIALIGLENHLNYIHRPGGTMDEDEIWGLAALYNSALIDTYFRTLSGNTQVSATELRSIPLPDLDIIHHLGRMAKGCTDVAEVEMLVNTTFNYRPSRKEIYEQD